MNFWIQYGLTLDWKVGKTGKLYVTRSSEWDIYTPWTKVWETPWFLVSVVIIVVWAVLDNDLAEEKR